MSYGTGRALMWARLVSVWGSTTAIARDGVNGPKYARAPGTPYIRPHFEDDAAEWVAIGPATGNRSRAYSTLVIEVFVPVGTGMQTGDGYCATLIDGFKGFQSGGVSVLERPFSRDVGSDGEYQKWFVFVPFYYEEVG